VSELVRSHPALEPWTFDRDALVRLGRAHHATYAAARPYPHVVIDGLLGEERSAALARAFPPASHAGWKRRDYAEQSARLGQLQRTGFEDVAIELRWLLAEMNSLAFVEFLGVLTGRRDLIADPHFTGAGLLATLPGGHLGVHVDFNRDSARHLDRVLSVLYYLPITWDETWAGELELWDRSGTACEVRIAPIRDRLVVMAFGEDHWHGHPSALTCPEGHMRAAVAAHYYAARSRDGDDNSAHGAIWR
jgi:Rps23 Pro-64 3,4-dihydroxylase Tpa1-like proline 4-hydroxylase